MSHVGRVQTAPKSTYAGRRVRVPLDASALEVSDSRWTPQIFVDSLGVKFTLDVAADAENTKCKSFYDIKANGLEQSWAGETC